MLDALWSGPGLMTGRQIHGAFPELAYTTIMTTLDRQHIAQRRGGAPVASEPRHASLEPR